LARPDCGTVEPDAALPLAGEARAQPARAAGWPARVPVRAPHPDAEGRQGRPSADPAQARPGLPAHVVAAVDVQVGPGDPGGLLVDQEGHRVGDLLRLAETTGGNVGGDPGAIFTLPSPHHVSGYT